MTACANSDLKRSIIDTFLPFNPQRIILFGSHARGDAGCYSDIGIAIVCETGKQFVDRLEELRSFFSGKREITDSQHREKRRLVRAALLVFARFDGRKIKRDGNLNIIPS